MNRTVHFASIAHGTKVVFGFSDIDEILKIQIQQFANTIKADSETQSLYNDFMAVMKNYRNYPGTSSYSCLNLL